MGFDQATRGPSWRRDRKCHTGSCSIPADLSVKTSSVIQSFFLAMTMHPEIVRLAQRELDGVTGGERLPDFSDKPQLPYVSAVMKEVLRWNTPNPLGTVFLHFFS